ncbi:hypothetical protein LRS71_17755 [Rhodococcus pyridinivorans]|uniref:hypothetical protein n=1 Tax=Rhodococcus pyridinivorans TaxID=103816 RepID=UPI001E3AA106|nr:hypothetical protein [Rhodococcus pyridinivorans]MCD5421381.1 hypothetical protein [Rhodococcus pyridinivorans]
MRDEVHMDQGIVLGWASVVLALVAIPLTWFLARRGRQRPDLQSATDFDVIIKSEDGILDRLHMDFDGEKIRSVSRTRIALWNARGDTVRGSDILPADKLRLQLDSDDLALHVRLVAMSREQIGAGCEVDANDPTAAVVFFDFLDASDGFIVELLHQKPVQAKLVGTIRGAVVSGPKGALLSPPALDLVAKRWFSRIKSKVLRLLLVCFAAFTLGLGAITAILIFRAQTRKPTLVDASDFDLSTLEGQRLFTNAVSAAENTNFPFLLLIIGVGFFFILTSVVLAVIVKAFLVAVIPRSIVLVRQSVTREGEDRAETPDQGSDDSSHIVSK